jgi:hypothetical protein
MQYQNKIKPIQATSCRDEVLDIEFCCRNGIVVIRKLVFFASDTRNKDKSDLLMLLYEFEARCKLGDPAVEEVLEVLLKIPNPDPKPFETIAGQSSP